MSLFPPSSSASVLARPSLAARFLRLALAACGLIGLSSCSALVSDVESSQCKQTSDCVALGISEATCKDNFCVVPDSNGADPYRCSPATPSEDETVSFTFSAGYTAAPNTPSPFTIVACERLDVNCDS